MEKILYKTGNWKIITRNGWEGPILIGPDIEFSAAANQDIEIEINTDYDGYHYNYVPFDILIEFIEYARRYWNNESLQNS